MKSFENHYRPSELPVSSNLPLNLTWALLTMSGICFLLPDYLPLIMVHPKPLILTYIMSCICPEGFAFPMLSLNTLPHWNTFFPPLQLKRNLLKLQPKHNYPLYILSATSVILRVELEIHDATYKVFCHMMSVNLSGGISYLLSLFCTGLAPLNSPVGHSYSPDLRMWGILCSHGTLFFGFHPSSPGRKWTQRLCS